MNCPYCGKLTDPRLDSCPHCGGLMSKGSAQGSGAKGPQKQTCPSCHTLVQDGDIICVACGTNLLTGQKISAESKLGPSAKKFSPWMIVSAVVGTVVVVCLIIGLVFLLKDPVQTAADLSARGKNLEAIETLKEHVANKPNDARAHLGLGKLEWKSKNYLEASRHFQEVARLESDNLEASRFALVCITAVNRGKTSANEVKILQRIANKQRNDVDTLYLLGMAKGLNNNVTEQIEALETAYNLDSSDSNIQCQLGIAYALQGDYIKAEMNLRAALRAQPDNGDIMAALGFVTRSLGNNEESMELLRQSIENTAARQEILIDLGLTLIREGNYSAAQPYLERAAGPARDNRIAVFFNAICLGALGLNDAAISDFKYLSQGQDEYALRACVQMAQLYLGMGGLEQARQAIEKANRMGGRSAAMYTIAGAVEAQAGAYVEAQEFLRRALETDPQYPPAHLEYGLLHVKRQAFSEGLSELERYLQLEGADSEDQSVMGIRALVEQLRQTINDKDS